jgi:phosphohistidine swiveling domain-containing protein
MVKQKITLKETPIYKIFPVLKKVPYRTFFGMPEEFKEVPMVYTLYFNWRKIKVRSFVNLFLRSPKKYEKLGKEGIRKVVEDIRKIEDIQREYWPKLDKKEKIAFSFVLFHVYWASWTENGIYEIMIDCPPPKFNVESFVPKNRLKMLEKIKKECTKEYEKFDVYGILVKLMQEIKENVSKDVIKKRYQKEVKRLLEYKNFEEMMKSSIFQLIYKHPGIFRFKQPIPRIFKENVKYVAKPKKYFIFPIKKEKLGQLKGLGASSGIIKGKVKICHEVKEGLKKIKKGEILVCPKTDPSWMPILSKVSGVITEVGGLLSHAAIVSRELKIPCIVGVREVFKKLKDGDLIEMNGETGEIKILGKVK